MIRDGSNKKEKSEMNWVIEVMVMGDLIFFFFCFFIKSDGYLEVALSLFCVHVFWTENGKIK